MYETEPLLVTLQNLWPLFLPKTHVHATVYTISHSKKHLCGVYTVMHAHKIRIDKPCDRQCRPRYPQMVDSPAISPLGNGTGFGTLHKDFHHHSTLQFDCCCSLLLMCLQFDRFGSTISSHFSQFPSSHRIYWISGIFLGLNGEFLRNILWIWWGFRFKN
jgi:hypothetical protein